MMRIRFRSSNFTKRYDVQRRSFAHAPLPLLTAYEHVRPGGGGAQHTLSFFPSILRILVYLVIYHRICTTHEYNA